MLVCLINCMAGSFTQHALLVSQSGPASGRLNVSSPPKGRGFHIRFSDLTFNTVAARIIVTGGEQSRGAGPEICRRAQTVLALFPVSVPLLGPGTRQGSLEETVDQLDGLRQGPPFAWSVSPVGRPADGEVVGFLWLTMKGRGIPGGRYRIWGDA